MTKTRKNYLVIILVTVLLLVVIGISYAAFSYTGTGQKLNTITTGAISMEYVESTNVISMNNALPTTDATGKKLSNSGEYFDFTVKSSIAGNTDINYEIAAKEESGNTFSGNNIRYYLTTVDANGKETEVMAPRTYYEEPTGNGYTGRPADMMSLYTGNLATQGETEIKYRLRLWVDESYNPQSDNGGLVYKVKVNVYGQTSDTVAQAEDTYCKDNGINKLSDCMLVMNNHEASAEAAGTAIVAKGTPNFAKIAPNSDEEDGLYAAADDEGTSYYYRGAVRNNYVSFAGFTWRIIRRNGDGSVRMIYSGKSTSDTGTSVTIGNSQYNSKYWDPAYVGYKYNEKFSLHENNETTGYNWFTNTQKYNFGTGYTFDESTKKFTLTGTIKQLTWKDNSSEIVSGKLYSCLNTSCNVVYKITGYQSDTRMTVQPISYSSDSYDSAVINNTNSVIKNTIDTWYKNNHNKLKQVKVTTNHNCNWYYELVASGTKAADIKYDKSKKTKSAKAGSTLPLKAIEVKDGNYALAVVAKSTEDETVQKIVIEFKNRPEKKAARAARTYTINDNKVSGLEGEMKFFPGKAYSFTVEEAGMADKEYIAGDERYQFAYWSTSSDGSNPQSKMQIMA